MPDAAALMKRLAAAARPPEGRLDGWLYRRLAVFEAITGVLGIMFYLARYGDAATRQALADNLPSLIDWILAIYIIGGSAHAVLMAKLRNPAAPDADAAPGTLTATTTTTVTKDTPDAGPAQ